MQCLPANTKWQRCTPCASRARSRRAAPPRSRSASACRHHTVQTADPTTTTTTSPHDETKDEAAAAKKAAGRCGIDDAICGGDAHRYAGQSPWQLHGHLAMLPDGRPHWTPQPPPPKSNNIAMELVGNGFNARLSDALSLDRNITDNRHPMCRRKSFDLHALPKASVVIVRVWCVGSCVTARQVFHQEYLSVLLRSIHSILNRHAPHEHTVSL